MTEVECILREVRLLVAHGAPIDEVDSNGLTPLHKACVRGCVEAVKLLLEHGHPISVGDMMGQTPLHSACEGGNVAVVKILLDHRHPVNVLDRSHCSPLHDACISGSVEVVEVLLAHGALPDEKIPWGPTPLHIACIKGNLDIVKLLSQHGAQIGGQSGETGQTPLHSAYKNMELVKFLLQMGASMTDKNGYREMPLHTACRIGEIKFIKTLLDHGAPVNAIADKPHETPLYVASSVGDPVVVQVLLEHGATLVAASTETYLFTDEVMDVLLDYSASTNITCKCFKCTGYSIVPDHSAEPDYHHFLLVDSHERHFIKSLTAGVHINEDQRGGANRSMRPDLGTVDWSQSKRHSYQIECLAELEAMKTEKVENTNVSYFSVLRHEIPALRNHVIMKILSPENLREKFPIYGNMIYCSYLNLPKRSSLLDRSSAFLDKSDLPRLPPECLLEMLDYLTNEDLERVLQACELPVSKDDDVNECFTQLDE